MVDLNEAAEILRKAKPYVSRTASIGAQQVSREITDFISRYEEQKEEKSDVSEANNLPG